MQVFLKEKLQKKQVIIIKSFSKTMTISLGPNFRAKAYKDEQLGDRIPLTGHQ
jgi:hypothetical protein